MTSNTPSNPPSSRPMTLRQQLAALHASLIHHAENEHPDPDMTEPCKYADDVTDAIMELVDRYGQEVAREARPNVFRDAKAACSFDLTCKSCVSNSMTLDYLAQPELTQKPPQPQGADSHTDIGDTVQGHEAGNLGELLEFAKYNPGFSNKVTVKPVRPEDVFPTRKFDDYDGDTEGSDLVPPDSEANTNLSEESETPKENT